MRLKYFNFYVKPPFWNISVMRSDSLILLKATTRPLVITFRQKGLILAFEDFETSKAPNKKKIYWGLLKKRCVKIWFRICLCSKFGPSLALHLGF